MATRRSFTFGSLVLAMTGASTARAGAPSKSASGVLPELRWSHTAQLDRNVLAVQSRLTNTADQALEVVVARGPLPGLELQARTEIDGEPLDLTLMVEGDRRRVFMSRMGPIPQWAPLAARGHLDFGPYRFAWPRRVPAHVVELQGWFHTEHGTVEIAATVDPRGSVEKTS